MNEKYSVPLSKIINYTGMEIIRLSRDPGDIYISTKEVARPGLILAIDDKNFISDRIQFIGNAEMMFLLDLSEQEREESLERFFSKRPVTVIISADSTVIVPDIIIEKSKKYDVPLLKTNLDTSTAISSMVSVLNVELAERITRHGVLVDVSGEGILIVGESGVGKSETVIELIKRGHRLVADDAVEIRRVSSRTLVGSSPENIRYFIELRGIGIVDARRLFGMGAVKNTIKIDLVINLENWDQSKTYERMGVEDKYTEILGNRVPLIEVPVSPGRNLAIIIEVAAINNRQKKMGYNSAKELLSNLGINSDDIDNTRENDYYKRDIWYDY
ncbi:MAG: HPr(Ser) kinase/phosphatase [Clostridia bacterium]|nr:HPr(Ser) kinase/phosphatase [Clostridia bacterium]